jgi:hypothetical protein
VQSVSVVGSSENAAIGLFAPQLLAVVAGVDVPKHVGVYEAREAPSVTAGAPEHPENRTPIANNSRAGIYLIWASIVPKRAINLFE